MTTLEGIALSPGVVCGPAVTLRARERRTPTPPAGSDDRSAREQFSDACRAAEAQLKRLLEALSGHDEEARAIVQAHLRLVRDPMLMAEVEARLTHGVAPQAALDAAEAALLLRFASLSNPALRARAADLGDVCSCIRQYLSGDITAPSRSSASQIVCAPDLSPAQVVQLAQERPLAIVLEQGAESSHAAILMRALANHRGDSRHRRRRHGTGWRSRTR
jgi:phosphoenolpyruvate-protein kinase (PTS system EI component)